MAGWTISSSAVWANKTGGWAHETTKFAELRFALDTLANFCRVKCKVSSIELFSSENCCDLNYKKRRSEPLKTPQVKSIIIFYFSISLSSKGSKWWYAGRLFPDTVLTDIKLINIGSKKSIHLDKRHPNIHGPLYDVAGSRMSNSWSLLGSIKYCGWTITVCLSGKRGRWTG